MPPAGPCRKKKSGSRNHWVPPPPGGFQPRTDVIVPNPCFSALRSPLAPAPDAARSSACFASCVPVSRNVNPSPPLVLMRNTRWWGSLRRTDSGGVSAPSTVLAGELDIWMTDAIVSSESIRSAERLLFCAQVASHFLLACVVYRVLVSREIIGA